LPTQNPKAYDLFLKGEYLLDRAWKSGRYDKDIDPAISSFEQATKLDPQFALAFAQLANAQLTEYHFGVIDYSSKRMPELLTSAKESIDRALSLQSDLPAAHSALGYWYFWGKSDLDAGLTEFRRAFAIDPRLSDAIFGIAGIALRRGCPDEAIEHLSKGLEVDPRNVRLVRLLAESYRMRKDYGRDVEFRSRAAALDPTSAVDAVNLSQSIIKQKGDILSAMTALDALPTDLQKTEAVAQQRIWLLTLRRDFAGAKKVVESLPPESWRSPWQAPRLHGEIERALGEKERARQSFEQAHALLTSAIAKDPEEALAHADLASVDAQLGLANEALREADRAVDLQPLEKNALWAPAWLANRAAVNAQLGRHDEAIRLIHQMVALRVNVISACELKLDPAWDPLRGDPRFEELIFEAEAKEKH